jgi:hypothetical protein
MFKSGYQGSGQRLGQRLSRWALCLGAAGVLYGAAAGCAHSSANDVAASLTGSTKKPDGEPCAKDTECINVCLTAAEADQQPTTKPNTCGKTSRVSPN